MNKMNKKGFTLIEMLVVIAIIAVLVAIIIPVVTSSTDKAAAATNAANLRSLKAEAVTASLTGQTETANLKITYTKGNITAIEPKNTAPVSKKGAGCDGGKAAKFEITDGGITATYEEKTIAYFSTYAENGSAPAGTTAPKV